MVQMTDTIRNAVKIGNAHLLDLEVLVPDQPVRLLALGHLVRDCSPAAAGQLVEPLTAINYLVVGTGGDLNQMLEAVDKIKEKNPELKVILADSLETPCFPIWRWNQEPKPPGVEAIIHIPKEMTDASRNLLFRQAGLLTGQVGGLACGAAFMLAENIEVESTVAFTMTNFDMNLQSKLY